MKRIPLITITPTIKVQILSVMAFWKAIYGTHNPFGFKIPNGIVRCAAIMKQLEVLNRMKTKIEAIVNQTSKLIIYVLQP
jgi:hypothetical protein